MIPHTLVLKPGLVIHSLYNGYWFWGRPSFYDLWHDLREAIRENRPDWDLSTPGLRQAWDAGDRSPFHGWDRRPGEALTATRPSPVDSPKCPSCPAAVIALWQDRPCPRRRGRDDNLTNPREPPAVGLLCAPAGWGL
jgi:hypothetical protein